MGSLPTSLFSIRGLTSLNLSGNAIGSTLPSSLGASKNLQYVFLFEFVSHHAAHDSHELVNNNVMSSITPQVSGLVAE